MTQMTEFGGKGVKPGIIKILYMFKKVQEK